MSAELRAPAMIPLWQVDGTVTSGRWQIQSDRKVTQPILKYLLMVAIQYSSIGLINTQYRCDYAKVHAGHVML
jgi:hypothetical protein